MNAVHNGALVAALTAKAPSQTAGHRRGPQMSRLAMAIPVGAQTVVTGSATNATRNPISAAAAYAMAIAALIRIVRPPEIFGWSRVLGYRVIVATASAM